MKLLFHQQLTFPCHYLAMGGNIESDERISADPRMITDMNGAEYLGSSADINMVADGRDASAIVANCYLLEYQAIATNLRIGVDHDAVRMRYQKASAYLHVEGNICTRDSRPKPMPKNCPLSAYQ